MTETANRIAYGIVAFAAIVCAVAASSNPGEGGERMCPKTLDSLIAGQGPGEPGDTHALKECKDSTNCNYCNGVVGQTYYLKCNGGGPIKVCSGTHMYDCKDTSVTCTYCKQHNHVECEDAGSDVGSKNIKSCKQL